MHPGPTAFLYVIGIGRFTEEDEGVYNRIKSLFDDRVTGYTIIIFTRGDELKRQNKTIKDVLSTAPDTLLKALDECDNRYVVFDNFADDKQPQVNSLLQLVRKMSEGNGGTPYTCPKYEEVGEQINEEVARRLRKVQEEEMMRKKYLQELVENLKLVEQKAEKERKEFEKKEAEREERMKKAEEEREEKMAVLQKMINEQKLSVEQQKAEEKKLREEKQQMIIKLEKERKDGQMRIEKQEKEKDQLLKDKEAALKAEREAHQNFIKEKEKEVQKIKTEASQKSRCIIL